MASKSDSIVSRPDQENSGDIKVIEPTFDHCKDAEAKLKRYISQGAIPKSFPNNMMDFGRSNTSVVKLCPAPHIEELELDTIPSSITAREGYVKEENDDYTE